LPNRRRIGGGEGGQLKKKGTAWKKAKSHVVGCFLKEKRQEGGREGEAEKNFPGLNGELTDHLYEKGSKTPSVNVRGGKIGEVKKDEKGREGKGAQTRGWEGKRRRKTFSSRKIRGEANGWDQKNVGNEMKSA